MKKVLKSVELKHVPLWRIILVGAIGFVVFVIVLCLLSLGIRNGLSRSQTEGMPNRPYIEMDESVGGSAGVVGDGVGESSFRRQGKYRSDELSYPLTSMPLQYGDEPWSTGLDAEQYETTRYGAVIRTSRLDSVCDSLASWRSYDYISFESSRRGQHDCNFRFKVEQSDAPGVVRALEELNPTEFVSYSQTVKRQLQSAENEIKVLTEQLYAIQDTLSDADEQYKELMRSAAESGDKDTIAVAIRDRMDQISELSEQARMVSSQIATLEEQATDNKDQTQYTFFTVSVRDYNIVDTTALRDSWVKHMQRFVLHVNDIFAGITIGMLGFLLRIVEIGFYLGVILIVAKVGYQLARKLWSHQA